MLTINRTITLTPAEDKLCALLEEFRVYVARTEPTGAQVECRIAGGWVRDKLLALPSNDIDLALSNHTGHPFATAFSVFLSENHPEIPRTSVAKIESNPDQSKHLETARQVILGLDLDFVNLRSEEYTGGSRIPSEMKFGTPLEDALRRDITINSLFYDVHTRLVEDHTKLGIPDLEQGLIRTPIEPHKTFEDDPLRLIRCVRFASRYRFRLTEEIRRACRDEGLKRGLRERISRERVGIEIDKMFAHENALSAFELIHSLDLYSSIFVLPPTLTTTQTSAPDTSSSALHTAQILDLLLRSSAQLDTGEPLPALHQALTEHVADKIVRKRLFLAACAAPWREVRVKVKKAEMGAPEMLIKEGIKLSGAEALFVSKLYQSAVLLQDPTLEKYPEPGRRSTIGNLLRLGQVHDPTRSTTWSTSTFWSLILELLPVFHPQTQTFHQDAKGLVEKYNTFVEEVIRLDLPRSIESKPMLDGNDIRTLLTIQGGPMLKTILDAIVSWQFDHPACERSDAERWVQEEFAKGSFGEVVALPKGKRKPKN